MQIWRNVQKDKNKKNCNYCNFQTINHYFFHILSKKQFMLLMQHFATSWISMCQSDLRQDPGPVQMPSRSSGSCSYSDPVASRYHRGPDCPPLLLTPCDPEVITASLQPTNWMLRFCFAGVKTPLTFNIVMVIRHNNCYGVITLQHFIYYTEGKNWIWSVWTSCLLQTKYSKSNLWGSSCNGHVCSIKYVHWPKLVWS